MLDLVTHDRAVPSSPAVSVAGRETLTYHDLAGLVGGAERLLRHDGKALVLCAGDRELPTLLAYLAGLRLGHTVAFLPATPEILAAYQPEFVVPAPGAEDGLPELGYLPTETTGARVFRRQAATSAGEIHPDTGVVVATSGSTGSPKAVRLSYAGVAANSAAIVQALGITSAECAPTTLPITHAYGLSVLNSHLLAGACIMLGNRSPLSLAMWDELTRAGATSFAAVPTTYAAFGPAHTTLLGRTRIRTMTQSGARLGEEAARRLGQTMAQRHGRFFVMYGQTEATSRIACLDPADLPARPGSVGRAVPGGTITIEPTPPRHGGIPGEGAVHYRGPGVMLGYAAGRADLARGNEVDVLDTGDLGYLRDGYLYLTGRTKRIVKILGVRVSLDDLEHLVEQPGHPTAVVSDEDDVVRLVGAGDPAVHHAQCAKLAASLGVPGRHVVFQPVDRISQTPGGKVDYQALADRRSGGGTVDRADGLAAALRPGS
ncbi:acyl-CoA synthetase (AMP-forming)/AMP-acid ligase II [Actinophytocola oryzae]|uniref:Acyl-CoA synthetase (AMP-forming)/AMP-acid ligase II n=1 Tax=Actinophytocola oryzae TaxID=502181 RepID=A0A4R7VJT8_9PSEU|nr:acyl-CoA synthetase (AMP-forming)/AMP-acid ligase II [Actinophytocola oryzae]